MKADWKRIDLLRSNASELEADAIEQYLTGNVGRRELLRYGATIGMSGAVLATLGLVPETTPRAQAAPANQTIRAGIEVPASAVDPVTTGDAGGLCMLQQVGEFLCIDGPDLVLRPALATSWKPNAKGDVWTFSLRQGVKFHDGRPMTADDVVATFDRLANPKNASNALSAFKGVLAVGGTRKVDDHTVAFHLDAPNGNFPYYTSSDNYNAIIIPADFKGDYEKSFIGTGPFKLEKYTAKVGASFTRFDGYWGPKALPARTEFTFYQGMQSKVLALQGRQVDIIVPVAVQGGQAILHDPRFQIIRLRSAAHEQVHMRTDMGALRDKRVRRAIALSLDRKGLVAGLFQGLSDLGNDSPFAPVFPSTNTSVPQRTQDIKQAKELLAAAGHAKGVNIKLTTEKYIEIPDYAVLIQNFAKAIGVNITLKVESQSAYYGKAVFGQSDWLDSEMGITDYGHRGVPNVYLAAPLKSDGTWNAAHFKNPTYDRLVASYVAALDLAGQRAVSKEIETLLLDETPVIFGYFYNYLSAAVKGLKGAQPTAMAQLFLQNATLS